MSLKIEMSLILCGIDPQCVICLPYWELSRKKFKEWVWTSFVAKIKRDLRLLTFISSQVSSIDDGHSLALCALTISSEISRLSMNSKPKPYRRSTATRHLYEYDSTKYLGRLNNLAAGQKKKKKKVSGFGVRNIYIIFDLCYFKTATKYES